MFTTQFRNDFDHFCRRTGLLSAPLALIAALGLAAAPSVSFADTETQDQAEAMAEGEAEAAHIAGPPPDRFPPICSTNSILAKLCGSNVALARVIERGSSVPENRVKVFRPNNVPWEHKGHDQIKDSDFDAVIKDTDSDVITVEITLSKEFLKEIATDQTSPIQVYGISIFGQLGPNSCIYDCQVVNGKKQCTCIGG